MRRSLLVIGAVTLAAVAVAADPPKLGPGWTYDKNMKEYYKMTPIKVTHSAGGNVQGYQLDLRHDKVLVHDTDNNIVTGVRINGTIHLNIRKDPKGGPDNIAFWLTNKCGYQDLDGDGVWDAWGDDRDRHAYKAYIWYDERWVRVCDSKGGYYKGTVALSIDRKTKYIWTGRAWEKRPGT